MDFGLTKQDRVRHGAHAGRGHFVGTPDYMPPEQIKGEPADARADVYALGCLLFHALTGRPPYDRDSEVAKMYAHLNDPPPSAVEAVPGTPAGLDAVIARALAKEPDGRYPSAGDLGRAARAALTGAAPSQPERSLATGPAAPAARSPRRTPVAPQPRRRRPRPPRRRAPARAAPAAPPAAPAPPAARCPGALARCPLPRSPRCWSSASSGGILAAAGVFSGDGGGSDGTAPAATGHRREERRRHAAQGGRDHPGRRRPRRHRRGRQHRLGLQLRGNTLTRLDAETNKRIGEPIPVGRNPDEVAAADGVVWVANTDDGTVTRVEAAGARRQKTVPGRRRARGALARRAAPLGGERRQRQREPHRPGVRRPRRAADRRAEQADRHLRRRAAASG